MKKLIDAIKKLLGMGDKSSGSSDSSSSGFTLIELLIVIAVIGILAAALLIAIDPIDKVKQGNDTKVINDVRSIYDGATRVYTQRGTFPANNDLQAIVDAGELKAVPTVPNSSYAAYSFMTDTNNVVAWGQVLSKVNRAKTGANPTPASAYFVVTGTRACYVATAPTSAAFACP